MSSVRGGSSEVTFLSIGCSWSLHNSVNTLNVLTGNYWKFEITGRQIILSKINLMFLKSEERNFIKSKEFKTFISIPLVGIKERGELITKIEITKLQKLSMKCFVKNKERRPGVVALTFTPRTREAEQEGL